MCKRELIPGFDLVRMIKNNTYNNVIKLFNRKQMIGLKTEKMLN